MSTKTSGIYMFSFSNGKKYIGSAVNLTARYSNHLEKSKSKYKGKQQVIAKAIAKHGIENIIWEILEYCDVEILIEREQYYLDELQPFIRTGKGYNVREIADSNLGWHPTKETRMKMSNSGKGRKFSKDHIQHMKDSWHNNRGDEYYKLCSDRMLGDKNPAKRPEVARKISESKLGVKWTPNKKRMKEHKEKSSKIMNKNWESDEFRDKMKKVHTGRKNSKETLKRMSDHQQSTYKLFDPKNNEFILMSKDLKLFCKNNNIGYTNMMMTKNNKGTLHKGWYMIKIY